MDYKKEIFKEDLVIKLGSLLSKDIFWSTSSHYQRQKSFTLSNNYFAYQVRNAVNGFCDLLKKEMDIHKKSSCEVCGLYARYETPTESIDSLNTFNQNIDNVLKLTTSINENLKKIKKELNSPSPAGKNDYQSMHDRMIVISQDIVTSADLAFDVSTQLDISSKRFKAESLTIKDLYSLGELKKTNRTMNFLKGKKSRNQEKIESTISKKYRS
jgi:hypothetical protein